MFYNKKNAHFQIINNICFNLEYQFQNFYKATLTASKDIQKIQL